MAINRQFLNDNHAELVAEIRAEGFAEGQTAGRSEGAQAERTRIQAVAAASMPGCGELVQQLMFDGVTTGEQAAAKVLAHYKGINAGALDKLQADAKDLPAVPAAPSASGDREPDASLPLEERCQQNWDRDPKVRAEFTSFETYLAYTKAVAAGRVKVHGKR